MFITYFVQRARSSHLDDLSASLLLWKKAALDIESQPVVSCCADPITPNGVNKCPASQFIIFHLTIMMDRNRLRISLVRSSLLTEIFLNYYFQIDQLGFLIYLIFVDLVNRTAFDQSIFCLCTGSPARRGLQHSEQSSRVLMSEVIFIVSTESLDFIVESIVKTMTSEFLNLTHRRFCRDCWNRSLCLITDKAWSDGMKVKIKISKHLFVIQLRQLNGIGTSSLKVYEC